MKIPVWIEPIANNGYRARGLEPFGLSGEGATREEAIARLRDELNNRLRQGAEIVAVDVPDQENPWLAMAGMHDPNDPLVQAWKKEMAAYRQEVENDPDAL